MAIMQVGAGGIETISGAMKKPKKQDGHNHGNYLIATHRKAATTNPNCQRVYVKNADAYKRSTPVGADEMWARGRFAAVALAVKERKANLSYISTDHDAFLAQKDQPYGKKTMRSYLWKVCGDAWDEQHPRD